MNFFFDIHADGMRWVSKFQPFKGRTRRASNSQIGTLSRTSQSRIV